ncbi:NAD(P)H-hydrate dehydratase [Myxococcota bacterium]
MIPVLSRSQMRAFDQCASGQCGVPSLLLMENAGRGAADAVAQVLAERRPLGVLGARVVVVAGPGNNGGDGFVVARQLLTRGARAEVVLVGRAKTLGGDAGTNARAWGGVGGKLIELDDATEVPELDQALADAEVVIDALFGTGLAREVSGVMGIVIEHVNRCHALRVSLDMPSGLETDRGSVLGVAVKAHITVTFAHYKLGLLTSEGARLAGRVIPVDIGVPSALPAAIGHSAELMESSDVALLLQPRSPAAHKGTAGRVLIVAGSTGKTGAALLTAHGALRAGAGLVTIANYPDAIRALELRVLETMTASIDPDEPERSLDALLLHADAVAIGPGLGTDHRARRLVEYVLARHTGVTVADADALTILASVGREAQHARGRLILTPHPGEMGRLLGWSTSEVERNRFGAVEACAELTQAVILLKGPRTLIGSVGGYPAVNAAGCPALATGGSGDVLTGMCAALACLLEPREAALSAAHLHGLAAERWAQRVTSDRGLLAHEIADEVPHVIAALTAKDRPMPV